ncbi:MAG TPA: YgiT-type zinc finger protein [Blastocatellia bacterium]|nr:YgiT-type zinc finger protein [Blastocatellia bacterium]
MSEGNYDYGKCQVCGEQMVEQQIKQDFWIKGDLIVIENIPAGVCPQCGEKVVKADVGRQIATLIANVEQMQPVRNINVPVLQFKLAA